MRRCNLSGNASEYRTRAPSAVAAAGLALAQRWIGSGWRTDPWLRPLFDALWDSLHLPGPLTSPADRTPIIGDFHGIDLSANGWTRARAVVDVDAVQAAWHSLGRAPEKVAAVACQTVNVVFVNFYTRWDGRAAVKELAKLEGLTDGYYLPPATVFADEPFDPDHWFRARTRDEVRKLRIALGNKVVVVPNGCAAPNY